jgi:perosamine synthetase
MPRSDHPSSTPRIHGGSDPTRARPSGRFPLRHVPPVAVPVTAADLRSGLAALLRPANSVERFQSALADRTGRSSCTLVSSGRAALVVILQALKRLSDRSRVVVPAYSCPTVVQAILASGLEPVFCDVLPHTLGLDPASLDPLVKSSPLAIIPTHLYGLVQDVTDLLTLGRKHGFFVIEDAAQAFGATVHGQMVGTLGDAGFYSLGRGKCLPVGHGGVIVANERCSLAIAEAAQAQDRKEPAFEPLRSWVLFVGYGLATRPAGWWFVAHTSLNPATEGMDLKALPPIRLSGLSAVQAAIGHSILGRLDRQQEIWRRNARHLTALLAEFDFVRVPKVAAGTEPVFLRFPFIADSVERASNLYDRLWKKGIGVSRSYLRTLPDLYSEQLALDPSGFPGAIDLAGCLLTLPTHSYLRENDWTRIGQAFYEVA